jgi:hypothetical protein
MLKFFSENIKNIFAGKLGRYGLAALVNAGPLTLKRSIYHLLTHKARLLAVTFLVKEGKQWASIAV